LFTFLTQYSLSLFRSVPHITVSSASSFLRDPVTANNKA
jgi:hypothetical protein